MKPHINKLEEVAPINDFYHNDSLGDKLNELVRTVNTLLEQRGNTINYMQMGEITACGHCDPVRFGEGLKQAGVGFKCECKCHQTRKPEVRSEEELPTLYVANKDKIGEWKDTPSETPEGFYSKDNNGVIKLKDETPEWMGEKEDLEIIHQQEIKEAVEEERNNIFKYLENNYIKHCKDHNALPYCKNCGLDLVELKKDLGV